MDRKDALLNLRLTPQERDAWHEVANAKGTTLSAMVRKYMNGQAKRLEAKNSGRKK